MKQFNDSLEGMGGIFKLNVFESGVLIEAYEDRNLIVANGRVGLMALLASADSQKAVTQISFGTNGAAPVLTDVSITGAFKKALTSTSFPSANSVAFNFTLEQTESNGVTIREFGLNHADNSLFARKVRSPIEKTASIRLEGVWTIVF